MTSKPCSVCFAASTLRCSVCKTQYYCGVDHQRLQWADHRAKCVAPAVAAAVAPAVAPAVAAAVAPAVADRKLLDIEDLATEAGIAAHRAAGGSCSCRKCSSLCRGTPGGYDPHHILRMIAEGADPDALYAGMVADYYLPTERGKDGGYPTPIFYLRPAADGERAGEVASVLPTYGSCSKLGPAGCTLARGDMPIGCVTSYGCRPCRPVDKDTAPVIWGSEAGLAVIRAFEEANRRRDPSAALGREIVVERLVQMATPAGVRLMAMGAMKKKAEISGLRAGPR